MSEKFTKPKQDNPLVKVTRPPQAPDPISLPGQEERWLKWAAKYGLDPALKGRARYMALDAAVTVARGGKWWDGAKPNLVYMNGLIDAVEGGFERKWRSEPIRSEELVAAYRATGRKPKVTADGKKPIEAPRTEAGTDFEEDAYR